MKMKKKLFTLLSLLVLVCTGAWASTVTVTLSGVTSKDAKGTTSVPSGIAASATITTGSCGSTCNNATYHLTSGDGKTYTYGGTTYYKVHVYEGTTKVNWNLITSGTLYGTFTVPAGYTYKITKVSHALAAESANFTASIVVKDAINAEKYSSGNISVTSGSAPSEATNIDIPEASQVTLNAGTYTLNVNASGSGSGKYFGIGQVVLTGSLETAAVDTNSPEITTDLEDSYSAFLGDEKTLSIETNHYTGIQWYKGSSTSADPANDEEIDGATSYAYSFTPSVTGDHYYYCVVTNDNATGTKTATSNVATVTVSAKTPVFTLSKSTIATTESSQIQVSGKSGLDGLTMSDLTYDDDVISINASGAITPVAPGTTSITFTTAASGNYAAGSANLSITVTGPVVASSTPVSWTGATTRTWSVSKISFGGAGEGGDNGLYFKTGNSNSIDYTSGDYFSLKEGNIMYLEVPSATSVGTVKVISTQTNADRYLNVVNSAGTQRLTMNTSGSTVEFDASSIEEINEKYYVKLSRGAGECKIAVSNFATVTLWEARNVTLNSKGYATFSNDFGYTVSGATAYKMTINASEGTIAGTAIEGKIPAGAGVLLRGTANAEVTINPVAGASALENNDLKGTTAADGSLVEKSGSNSFYVLNGDTFVTYTGSTFVANKAYFEVAASEARVFTMTFEDGETTGISAMHNSQCIMNNEFFDLQGRKVAQPTKGLYIVNGRKVVIK